MAAPPKMGPKTARAAELRAQGLTLSQIGRELGIKRTSNVANLLACAKRHAAGKVRGNGRPRTDQIPLEPPEPDDGFDFSYMGEPHCGRCGLRGAHECIKAEADAQRYWEAA